MKNIQIPYDLFLKLVVFHVGDVYDEAFEIKQEIQKKFDSLLRREYYTKYKTSPDEKEAEEYRRKYLDSKGVPESFRW